MNFFVHIKYQKFSIGLFTSGTSIKLRVKLIEGEKNLTNEVDILFQYKTGEIGYQIGIETSIVDLQNNREVTGYYNIGHETILAYHGSHVDDYR